MTPPQYDEGAGPWYRQIGWPAVAGTIVFLGLFFTGVPLWRSILIAITVGATLYIVLRSLAGARPEWPQRALGAADRPPGAWEVAGLEAAREQPEAFARALRPRLWELAQDLLRRRGIAPYSPQAAAIIGRAEYALLTGDDPVPPRGPSSVSRLCSAIARLAVDPGAGGPVPIRDPALAALAGTNREAPAPPSDDATDRAARRGAAVTPAAGRRPNQAAGGPVL